MISVRRYAELLRLPGVARSLASSLPGRLPIGMAMLALLLFLRQVTGSFADAGLVAGLYVLGLACVAPLLGRLIDRYGPRPVLTVSAAGYPVALGALTGLGLAGAPSAVLAPAAFLAGALFPPITVVVRTLLPRLVPQATQLQAAYSLDSALVQIMFIAGPAIVGVVAATGYPVAAVWLTALLAGGGAALFLRLPAMAAWERHAHTRPRGLLGPLALPGLRALLAATLCFASGFGLFEVGIAGFAAEHDVPAAAGLILACAGVGSTTGVLVFGGRDWRVPAPVLYRRALLAMGAGYLILATAGTLGAKAATAVVAGAPMAIAMAVQSILISRIAPRAMLAEGFTWSAMALLSGVSAGVAVGGAMLERLHSGWVFAAAGAMAWVASAAAHLALRHEHAPDR